MQNNFDACLTVVFQNEGGYTNNPRDPGGATNMGITISTLSNWRKAPQTPADVQALTATEAAAIYESEYWNLTQCDVWPVGVDLMVFDCAVNPGPGRAVRFLQQAVGVTADGAIGPATKAAVAAAEAQETVSRMATFREAYYRSRATFPDFGRGWLPRNDHTKAAALAMMGSNDAQ